MDRRNFLRTGGMAVLGSLAMPSLAMPESVRGALGGTDHKSAVAAAINHFGVTEADLKKVMAVALEKGGDYADLYVISDSFTVGYTIYNLSGSLQMKGEAVSGRPVDVSILPAGVYMVETNDRSGGIEFTKVLKNN